MERGTPPSALASTASALLLGRSSGSVALPGHGHSRTGRFAMQTVPTHQHQQRYIMHLDLDAFYAQVEMKRLGVRDEPLVVQQWQGIIAVNYPARKFGITRSDRAADARAKCPLLRLVHVEVLDGQGNVRTDGIASQLTDKVSLNRYRAASHDIFQLLVRICGEGRVEKASVDEAFVDLAPLMDAYTNAATAGCIVEQGVPKAAPIPFLGRPSQPFDHAVPSSGVGVVPAAVAATAVVASAASLQGEVVSSISPPPVVASSSHSRGAGGVGGVSGHSALSLLSGGKPVLSVASLAPLCLQELVRCAGRWHVIGVEGAELKKDAPVASSDDLTATDRIVCTGPSSSVSASATVVEPLEPRSNMEPLEAEQLGHRLHPIASAIASAECEEHAPSYSERMHALFAHLGPHDVSMAVAAVVADYVRWRVWEELRFTCSAGIAPNKMLAKLGSARNKPDQQTIIPHACVPPFIAAIPLSKIRFLGGKLGSKLRDVVGAHVSSSTSAVSLSAATSSSSDGVTPSGSGGHDHTVFETGSSATAVLTTAQFGRTTATTTAGTSSSSTGATGTHGSTRLKDKQGTVFRVENGTNIQSRDREYTGDAQWPEYPDSAEEEASDESDDCGSDESSVGGYGVPGAAVRGRDASGGVVAASTSGGSASSTSSSGVTAPKKSTRSTAIAATAPAIDRDALTAGMAQSVSLATLHACLGEEAGTWVYRIVRGVDDSEITPRFKPKSMLATKSFSPKACATFKDAVSWLTMLSAELSHRMEADEAQWRRRPRTLVLSYSAVAPRFHSHTSRRGAMPPKRTPQALLAVATALLRHAMVEAAAVCADGSYRVGDADTVKDTTPMFPCVSLSLSASGFMDQGCEGQRTIASAFAQQQVSVGSGGEDDIVFVHSSSRAARLTHPELTESAGGSSNSSGGGGGGGVSAANSSPSILAMLTQARSSSSGGSSTTVSGTGRTSSAGSSVTSGSRRGNGSLSGFLSGNKRSATSTLVQAGSSGHSESVERAAKIPRTHSDLPTGAAAESASTVIDLISSDESDS